MACAYLEFADFPHRGIPLRAWPEFSHLMFPTLKLTWEENSIINESVALNSVMQDTMNLGSSIADTVSLNSVILK